MARQHRETVCREFEQPLPDELESASAAAPAFSAAVERHGRLIAMAIVVGIALVTFGEIDFTSAPGQSEASVFEGPPAPHVGRLSDLPATDGPLRELIVEERVGAQRRQELVRVPLFLHEGECAEPHDLQLFAADDLTRPLPYQPDDIRRAADGSVSRMHLYFSIDLRPWETRRFVVSKGANPGREQPALVLEQTEQQVTLAGDDLQVAFWTKGPRQGAIAGIRTTAGKVTLTDDLLAPKLILHRQDANLHNVRRTEISYEEPAGLEVRDLRFGAGPLFAKFVVRVGPRGLPDAAEFTYLVPRHGNHLIQSERVFAEEGEHTLDVVGVGGHMLLSGRLALGASDRHCQVVPVPAGLRKLTRATRGQTNEALVNARDRISMLAVPHVQGGVSALEMQDTGHFALHGSPDFQRTAAGRSHCLRAFFGQVRLVFSRATTVDDLWEVSRAHMQPLTAVVEEPGLTTADLQRRLRTLLSRLPATSAKVWMHDVARLCALEDTASLSRLLGAAPVTEEDPNHWLHAARAARAEHTRDGTLPLSEEDKGMASGPLDPWKLTCNVTPLAALAARTTPAERLARICHAIGKSQRNFNGRLDHTGFPYIDCDHSFIHLQMGSTTAGLIGAVTSGDDELAAYYRDCCRAPGMLDVFGHGQRASTTLTGGRDSFHHASVSDFMLRVNELATGEDLWLHPALFGRYFDCLDVNADLYQRVSATGWYRAAYLRGQAHEQQFACWSAAPFLGLLAHTEGTPLGLTEACYFAEHLAEAPLDQLSGSILFHVDQAAREGLHRARRRSAPTAPTGVQVDYLRIGNRLHWQPSPSPRVQGYRVYRGDSDGGPWVLLNSPYTQPVTELFTGCNMVDSEGQRFHSYLVTAIDVGGRESRWFGDEPAR